MAPTSRNPTSWAEYEGHPSLSGSVSSSVLNDEQALLDDGDDEPLDAAVYGPQRRRSSVTERLAAMADVGGVNSFRSFARSWQRAAGFTEVIPRRPSFVFAHDDDDDNNNDHPIQDDDGDDIQYGRSLVDHRPPGPETSLLRQHLTSDRVLPTQQSPASSAEATRRAGGQAAGASSTGSLPAEEQGFRERESKAFDSEMAAGGSSMPPPSTSTRSSIFAVPPHLATPSIIGSYSSYRSSHYGTIGGGTGGTLRPRVSVSRLADGYGRGDVAGDDHDEDDEDDDEDEDAHGEHDPILVKEVKQGNKVVLTVEGQSTLPQSIFNSINAIIGVGLLSLPLAFKMSGWIFGLAILTLTAAVTAHTSNLLARCMRYDPSLITYSDLAYVSFGHRARMVVSALFSLELVAACVALVILFADSLDLLLPGVAGVNFWKCVCAVLILLLNAMPLRWLSYTSVLGIFSTFCIVCIVIIDGLVKEEAPGSLWQPATTYIWPSNWLSLPLAYGLLASPWGAHSVFPSIYRDMRHPHKWGQAVKVTFSFSYVLDTCLAVIGILMFGDGIKDAITSNILKTAGFPEPLTYCLCIFIAIIPLTKIPLNARPLITTADVLSGIHQHHHHHHHHTSTTPASRRSALILTCHRAAIRVAVVLVLLVISIAFPAFDSVCAFLGAALCSLISIILPISFYLKLYWRDISFRERVVSWFLLVLFSILGTVGTIWTFLPKHIVGA